MLVSGRVNAVFSYKSKVLSSLPVMPFRLSEFGLQEREKAKRWREREKARARGFFLHPGKLMAGTQKWRFGRWFSCSIGWCLGYMLIFRGINIVNIFNELYSLKGVFMIIDQLSSCSKRNSRISRNFCKRRPLLWRWIWNGLSFLERGDTVDGFRNPAWKPVEVDSLSYYLQGFIHPNGGWPWDFWTIDSIYQVVFWWFVRYLQGSPLKLETLMIALGLWGWGEILKPIGNSKVPKQLQKGYFFCGGFKYACLPGSLGRWSNLTSIFLQMGGSTTN